jgi:hypothetical protein
MINIYTRRSDHVFPSYVYASTLLLTKRPKKLLRAFVPLTGSIVKPSLSSAVDLLASPDRALRQDLT